MTTETTKALEAKGYQQGTRWLLPSQTIETRYAELSALEWVDREAARISTSPFHAAKAVADRGMVAVFVKYDGPPARARTVAA